MITTHDVTTHMIQRYPVRYQPDQGVFELLTTYIEDYGDDDTCHVQGYLAVCIFCFILDVIKRDFPGQVQGEITPFQMNTMVDELTQRLSPETENTNEEELEPDEEPFYETFLIH